MNRDRMNENALRLAGALERHADRPTVERLATILDYVPDQLQEDIRSLATVLEDLAIWQLPDLEELAANLEEYQPEGRPTK